MGKSVEIDPGAGGWRRKWRVTATRYKVSFSDDENILELVEVLTGPRCESTRCMDSNTL